MMTKKNDVYRCETCGHIVEVKHSGSTSISCCGKKMTHLEENTVEASLEKHIPVIEKIQGGYKVVVGSVEHPMAEEHNIEFITLVAGETVLTAYLKPGEKPEAIFLTDATEVEAKAFCNLHGYWKSK